MTMARMLLEQTSPQGCVTRMAGMAYWIARLSIDAPAGRHDCETAR